MKYRRHHTIFTKIILWGSIFGITYIAQQSLITVQNIECHLENGQDCPSYITQELDSLKGKQLMFNTFEKELAQLQFDQPARIKIKYKTLPLTLVVEASIDPGLYRLQDSELVTTADGATFTGNQPNLPTVELENDNADPESLIADYHYGLKIIFESFAQQKLVIKKVIWNSDQDIRIALDSGLVVITDVNSIPTAAQKTKLILQSQANKGFDWGKSELNVKFRLPVLRNRS